MKSSIIMGLILVVSCFSGKKQSVLINEIKSFNVSEISIDNNFSVSFRDSTGKINWKWYESGNYQILPDSFINKYFDQIKELKKWRGYQECTIDGFSSLNDSAHLLIVNNRILNGNEANKFLIKLDKNKSIEKVFLLAKIEKSIDDLFEIFSVINNNEVLQTQIHTFIEGDRVITDSIVYNFNTNDFVNYQLIRQDSIRTIEFE